MAAEQGEVTAAEVPKVLGVPVTNVIHQLMVFADADSSMQANVPIESTHEQRRIPLDCILQICKEVAAPKNINISARRVAVAHSLQHVIEVVPRIVWHSHTVELLFDAILAVRAMDDTSNCQEANAVCRSIGEQLPFPAWIHPCVSRIVQVGATYSDNCWILTAIVARLEDTGTLTRCHNEDVETVIESTTHALHAVCVMVTKMAKIDAVGNESLQDCVNRLRRILPECVLVVETLVNWISRATNNCQGSNRDCAEGAALFGPRVLKHRVGGRRSSSNDDSTPFSVFDYVAVLCCRLAAIADGPSKERVLQVFERICRIVNHPGAGQSERDWEDDANNSAMDMSTALARSSVLHCLAIPTWQSIAGTAEAAVELLRRIRYPHVSTRVLNTAVACALELTDHHDVKFRKLGLAVVLHIVPNVLVADLKLSGQIHVIADLLQRLLHTTDVGEAEALYAAYALVLPVLEPKPSMRASALHDRVLGKLLENILCTTNTEKRRAFLQAAPPIVRLLGIGVVKHFKRVFEVIDSCLDVDNESPDEWRGVSVAEHAAVVLACLRFVEAVVTQGWPRMRPRARGLEQRLRAVERSWGGGPDDGDRDTSSSDHPQPQSRNRHSHDGGGNEIRAAVSTCIAVVVPFIPQ
eukprot:m.255581 g.255581  ORF g.255581 m.255581 type:complete len:639 (+) comp19621_c0_seq2:423-2339(+)